MTQMRTIGVVLDDDSKMGLNHTYFSEILESFKIAVEENNYSLIFLNNDRTRKGAKTYLEQLVEFGCAGCMMSCKNDCDEIDEIRKSQIPMVAIDKDYDDAICVSSDNAKGMELLTEYLIEMGHRKIAIILGDDNSVTNIRFNGFLRACEKHGIQIPDEYICRGSYRSILQSHYHTEKLLKLKDVPTAIMFSDDYASIGGINIIHARALTISKDISITGYDSNEILSQLEPKLTTIKQDCVGIGRVAAEKIMAEIENPDVKQTGKYTVDVDLEKGRTVGRVYDAAPMAVI